MQTYMESRKDLLGGELITYSSGDGSISLSWAKSPRGNALGVKVELEDAKAKYREDRRLAKMKITKANGNYSFYTPVHRLGDDLILHDGKEYKYEKIHEQNFNVWNAFGEEVKNLSIKSIIMFYVNNEKRILAEGDMYAVS